MATQKEIDELNKALEEKRKEDEKITKELLRVKRSIEENKNKPKDEDKK